MPPRVGAGLQSGGERLGVSQQCHQLSNSTSGALVHLGSGQQGPLRTLVLSDLAGVEGTGLPHTLGLLPHTPPGTASSEVQGLDKGAASATLQPPWVPSSSASPAKQQTEGFCSQH